VIFPVGSRVKLTEWARQNFREQAVPIGDRVGTVVDRTGEMSENVNLAQVNWDNPVEGLWTEWHISWLRPDDTSQVETTSPLEK
jgi:hypothetical protein